MHLYGAFVWRSYEASCRMRPDDAMKIVRRVAKVLEHKHKMHLATQKATWVPKGPGHQPKEQLPQEMPNPNANKEKGKGKGKDKGKGKGKGKNGW